MKNIFFYTLLLVILNSILIVNQTLGINVILFTIPLLVFLFNYLKLNKLIKNKLGLLFFIPIIILSGTYFIYDNVFNELNIVIIPILYILMFIFTTSSVDKLGDLITKVMNTIFRPFDYIGEVLKGSRKYFDSKIKLSKDNKNKIKSILISIPVIILVIVLLSSADQMFNNLFSKIFELIKDISLSNIIYRLIIMLILFVYLNATLMVVLNKLGVKDPNKTKEIDSYTMKVLLTALNIIYLVFDFIQIKSLFLHNVTEGIKYADYARSGFFQLMLISIINIVIILLYRRSKENKYNKLMSLIMVLLTLVIIASSFYRMVLYSSAYGYTVLRLGVYVTLITEVILLIPTVIYIFRPKLNILSYYVVILTIVYTAINLFSVDVVITDNNIKRYREKDDIDLDYLMNDHSDNIKQLIELKDELKEEDLKLDLEFYLEDFTAYDDDYNFLEYNISKTRAEKLLK